MSGYDTTKEIWEKLYMVRLPSLDATSMSFLKHHGTYVTGIKEIDNANVNNWITTYITIDKMVEFYKQGVTVSVIRPSDTQLIYEAIEKHLVGWRTMLEKGINIGNAPIEDLIEMDKFANAVYEHARYHIPEELIESLFKLNIGKRIRAIPGQMFRPEPSVITEEEKHPQQRNSMAEFLKSRVHGIKRF